MTVTAAEKTAAKTPITRALYVVATPNLKGPYVLLRSPEWTILILRTGKPAGELAPLFGALEPEERVAWFVPWRVPIDANVWDYIPPGLILSESQVKPEHVLPAHLEWACQEYLQA